MKEERCVGVRRVHNKGSGNDKGSGRESIGG